MRHHADAVAAEYDEEDRAISHIGQRASVCELEPDTRITLTAGIHHRLAIVDAKIIFTDVEQRLHGTSTAYANIEDWLAPRQCSHPAKRSLFGQTQFR